MKKGDFFEKGFVIKIDFELEKDEILKCRKAGSKKYSLLNTC